MDCGLKANPLKERVFKCPECGGLYDVETSDVITLPGFREKMFDERCIPGKSSYNNSGVWRFSGTGGLLMPFLDHSDTVSLGEGLHRMTRAGENLRGLVGGDLDLWILEEGANPTGSFKDNGMTVAVSVAKSSRAKITICRSTGDTSAAAAAYSAHAGIPCVVLLPRDQGITAAQMAQPLAHGAIVITYPGTFDSVKDAYNELVASGMAYSVNSINPFRIEGHTATAYLSTQFFRWELPDWFAVPVGNGSNSTSIGIGMRRLLSSGIVQDPGRILGVQTHSATPLYNSWRCAGDGDPVMADEWLKCYVPQTKHIPGLTAASAQDIGDPASFKKVIREIGGYRETEGFPGAMEVAEEKDLRAALSAAAKDGLEVCPQTAVVFAGLRTAVAKGIVGAGSRVVVVSTAHMMKFTDAAVAASGNEIKEITSCSADEIARIAGL